MMKNPAIEEIIKTKFKAVVKNNSMLQIVIAEKQIKSIAFFTWYLSIILPQKTEPNDDNA